MSSLRQKRWKNNETKLLAELNAIQQVFPQNLSVEIFHYFTGCLLDQGWLLQKSSFSRRQLKSSNWSSVWRKGWKCSSTLARLWQVWPHNICTSLHWKRLTNLEGVRGGGFSQIIYVFVNLRQIHFAISHFYWNQLIGWDQLTRGCWSFANDWKCFDQQPLQCARFWRAAAAIPLSQSLCNLLLWRIN